MNDSTPKILKTLREKKGWSKTELARRLNLKAVSTYANWEYGTRTPDKDMLAKIAELYGVSTDYIITGEYNIQDAIDEREFNSLEKLNQLLKDHGIENFGFFEIEKWKNLSPEDLDEIRRHFEWVAQKAKKRNEEKN